jgi:hypothetical protein
MLVVFGFLCFSNLEKGSFLPDRNGSTKDLAVILAGPLLPTPSRRKMESNARSRRRDAVAMRT